MESSRFIVHAYYTLASTQLLPHFFPRRPVLRKGSVFFLSINHTHIHYMERAIGLAKRAIGFTSPNPLVGAVIVKEGRILGEGYHEKYGQLHAERNALASCTESPAGASIYVTLEPCCHYGRTPPCTQALIDAGIAHVFVGSYDPNPLVAGKGIEALRDAGIQVTEAFQQEACDALNTIFFHYITHKAPYVALKYAMTADGKIATYTGASRWISGEESRAHAHRLRQKYAAILVGIGTVLADDPMLTCRIEGQVTRNPLRIVCDSSLRIPLESNLCKTARDIPTILACATATADKREALEALGVQVWALPNQNNQVDMEALLHHLHAEKIDSVLVEGGSQIHFSLLAQGLAQKLYTYLAPKVVGGKTSPSPVGGQGIAQMADAMEMERTNITPLGRDILLEYHITKGEAEDVHRNH